MLLYGANRDGVFVPAGHMCVGVSSAVQDGLLHLEQTAASNVSQTHFFMVCPVAPVERAHDNTRDRHTSSWSALETQTNIAQANIVCVFQCISLTFAESLQDILTENNHTFRNDYKYMAGQIKQQGMEKIHLEEKVMT